jgi:hypothetical protein
MNDDVLTAIWWIAAAAFSISVVYRWLRRNQRPLQWPPPWKIWSISRTRRVAGSLGRFLLFAVIVGGAGYYWYSRRASLPSISEIITPQVPESVLPGKPFYDRPASAPNGSPWPTTSSYIAGYPRLNVLGMADVIADNSGGVNDLFVKLIDRDQTPMKAVRVFFVQSKGQLKLERVKPGHYDLRYMNLDTGQIRRSDVFEVTYTKMDKRDGYMRWTIGLYGVIDGTTYHEEITQSEF